jgi:transcriptional repressor NrdR
MGRSCSIHKIGSFPPPYPDEPQYTAARGEKRLIARVSHDLQAYAIIISTTERERRKQRGASMKCPFCGYTESRVKDSRDVGDAIHRRRECEQCKGRFSTYERVEKSQLMIAKRDLRREPFDRQKLFVGISKACEKRPLAVADIESAVEDIEQELYRQGKQELPSSVIGELVMERLRHMDKIAYIRFASVYRSFNDVETMLEELQDLLHRKQADSEAQEKII